MYKKLIFTLLCLPAYNSNAAQVSVDFLVNADTRLTSISNEWVNDSSFTNQNFTLSVIFDSNDYVLGELDFWDGQGITSYRPTIDPISFSETPFESEINTVQSTLNYNGLTGVRDSETLSGEFSYNETFSHGQISQSYFSTSGVTSQDRSIDYIESFDKTIELSFREFDETLTLEDIVPLNFEEYLSLGLGKTFTFSQQVDESFNENWGQTGSQWITLDGGIMYSGTATMTNFSVVPIPAAVWLFGSGFIGLFGFAKRKKLK